MDVGLADFLENPLHVVSQIEKVMVIKLMVSQDVAHSFESWGNSLDPVNSIPTQQDVASQQDNSFLVVVPFRREVVERICQKLQVQIRQR